MLKIIAAKNADEAGQIGAAIFQEVINEQPDCVLGLATGSTPLPLYRDLIRRYENGEIDFSSVRSVNLDEYVGLAADHPQSYRYFMTENLFSKINIQPANKQVPNGISSDVKKACKDYEELIKSWGGIKLQLLGIGQNGHIGFNEPTDYFPSVTHAVELAQNTREVNKRFFNHIDEVPTHAITMGIGTIMNAKQVLLLATGESKAEILKRSLFGKIQPEVPASVLQLHRHLTVVADEAALTLIRAEFPKSIS